VDYKPPSPITFGVSVAFIVALVLLVKMVLENNAHMNLINKNAKNDNILKCSIRRL
jgi:hypothetical protein